MYAMIMTRFPRNWPNFEPPAPTENKISTTPESGGQTPPKFVQCALMVDGDGKSIISTSSAPGDVTFSAVNSSMTSSVVHATLRPSVLRPDSVGDNEVGVVGLVLVFGVGLVWLIYIDAFFFGNPVWMTGLRKLLVFEGNCPKIAFSKNSFDEAHWKFWCFRCCCLPCLFNAKRTWYILYGHLHKLTGSGSRDCIGGRST